MNKKFFAALASATMAFSATGSLAVFAQDFEEETNVIPGTPAENPTTVKWNKDNFGALVDTTASGTPVATIAITGGTWQTPKLGDDVNVDTLKDVTSITLNADFNGEVKGLEYFTGLTSFTDANAAVVKNTSLDFSANTALTNLTVKKATELSAITLPNADEKEAYHLTTLDLENTALTSLDLTAQKGLFPAAVPATGKETTIAVSGNKNLSDVVLPTATKKTNAYVGTLNLSANSLDSVNLNNYQISGILNLSSNHIGVLNLKNTTVPNTAANVILSDQTFYVAADAASVNLKDYFPSINLENVTPSGTGVNLEKDEETGEDTGVLTLATSGNTTYTYATGATDANLDVQIFKANPMHRLYNPNSGEHFYTKDNTEFEALVDLGWNDEGYGWVAPLDTATDALPVYRVYNPNAGDHHYTLNENEKNILVSIGWKDEEIGWYSAPAANSVTVYREYNPNAKAAGAHNYTTSKAENDFLVSVGWLMEGTAWYALQ